MNPFQRQRSFNRASQFRWQEFAAHRDRIASLLGHGESLCVLGAGNCNDLDLPRLAAGWSKILLVDVDVEAMRTGVANQFPFTLPQNLDFQACDLTGALQHIHELDLPKLRRALLTLPTVAEIGERFSAIASTCVLSQLIDIVRHAVGPLSPELPSLAELVRTQHLRTIAELTAPGGSVLLFADFVSSDTLPELLTARDEELPPLMDRALREGNCFTGMNPLEIQRTLAQMSCWSEPPAMCGLWRWNLGPRTYLVAALSCIRIF